MLCSLTALTYLDRICISIVGVRIKSDLHLSNEQFGWVLAAFALAYAVFEIPSGMLGDRIGPRKVFIRIVLLWSFFTAITGLVNGLIALLIVRFLFGVGESGTYPNSILVVSRWFPVSETGKALSWVGIGFAVGLCHCSIDHCTHSGGLRMEDAVFCYWCHRHCLGLVLLFMVP